MKHEDLLKLIQVSHDDGKSKDEVCTLLMTNGVQFSQIPKILKESGVLFGRSRNKVSISDQVVRIVVENPEISTDDIIEMILDITTNPKYFATHVGGIVREVLRVQNES